MKKAILEKIGEVYNAGGNIMKYLSEGNGNSIEDILISYDFQAGTYTRNYYDNPSITMNICKCFLDYVSELGPIDSIFEAGVGEANKLVTICNFIGSDISWIGGVICHGLV